MTTKQLRWLETNVQPRERYYRDIPLHGLTEHLIDKDVEFLKELLADWGD